MISDNNARTSEMSSPAADTGRPTFREAGYCFLDRLLEPEICDFATQYVKLSMARGSLSGEVDEQVPGAFASYADPFMETLLVRCRDDVERVTGLRIIPSYSYFRVYAAGDALARHFDRASCEISVTLCLGSDIKGSAAGDRWPIFLSKEKATRGAPGTAMFCSSGDAVVYRGCDVEHWRSPMHGEPGSYQVQAFLHYVDADGPFAELCKFDARPALGLPGTTRDRGRLNKAQQLLPDYHRIAANTRSS